MYTYHKVMIFNQQKDKNGQKTTSVNPILKKIILVLNLTEYLLFFET